MRKVLTLALAGLPLVVACGSTDAGREADGRPVVVVTTSILGDVVDAAAGGLVAVEVVMPRGADPHDFAPSAKAATAMEEADLVVAIGGGFEAGMADVVDAVAAAGTPVVEVVDVLRPADEDQADDDHSDEDAHDHGGFDPHVWTDPGLMMRAIEELGVRLAELDAIDADQLALNVDDYLEALADLDTSIAQQVGQIPPERRVLVTNHEVFGYFADRYGFEVIGAVVPSLTTNAEASARELEELADTIRTQGVPAIFVETTQATRLAEALAAEVGDEVELVELYTESLGEPGGPASNYIDMMRYDADAITQALSS